MPDYLYTRELIDGAWDIDNPARVDGESQQIHLATEIEAALPGVVFRVYCSGPQCKVTTTEALDAGDESTLDDVVAAHKANT